MRNSLPIGLLVFASCAHTPKPTTPPVRSAVVPEAPLQVANALAPSCIAAKPSHAQRIAERGSVLELYHRQDGVWLPHAPVLVNEDFDFALAMSMEDGLGAGLAAAKRKENNQKRAQELAELRLGEAIDAMLEALCACGREVYFVLWGREGKIKMVVEGKGEPKVVDGEGAAGTDGIVHRAEELLLVGAECG